MAGEDQMTTPMTKGETSGTFDSELEEFFQRLAVEGLLQMLRSRGRMVALRRRESQESLDPDGSMTGSFTETSASEADDLSVSTDSELPERDQEPAYVRRKWLKLGSGYEQKPAFADRFLDTSNRAEEGPLVADSDLDELLDGLEKGEAGWLEEGFRKAMDRSTETMSYVAWSMDMPSGATQYRSRMVIEDCDPETARDFFLDDAYRSEWDEARVTSSTLDDWNESGCQVARWVRKFPLFLRDREYVVARRIWSLKERTFHCISKLTTHPSAPQRTNPWRVECFHSSWRISPVEGRQGDGEMTACEVINFHLEESGLSRNLSKMAVSHGMWPYIQKLEQSMRKYHAAGKNVKHALPVFLIQADAKVQRSKKGQQLQKLQVDGQAVLRREEESKQTGKESGAA